jgi:hypothetical protein
MKNQVIACCILGITLCFQSCTAGYVETVPLYVDSPRPPRPTTTHIWIDGEWEWNRHTHTYGRKDGHWEMPQKGRKYVPGEWRKSSKGQYWYRGHWN